MDTPTTESKWEGRLGWLVVGTCAFTVGAVGLLHFLQPDLSPFERAISEYVHGRFGFLMTATFYSQSVGSVALGAIAIRHSNARRRTLVGGVLFMVSAVGAAVAGVFPADLAVPYPETPGGTVHAIAGLSRFLSLTVALPLLSSALVMKHQSQRATKSLVLLSRLFGLVFVVSIVVLANNNLFGVGQRTFIAILLIWMLIAVYPLISQPEQVDGA
jgi:hypothetical membrane protein